MIFTVFIIMGKSDSRVGRYSASIRSLIHHNAHPVRVGSVYILLLDKLSGLVGFHKCIYEETVGKIVYFALSIGFILVSEIICLVNK